MGTIVTIFLLAITMLVFLYQKPRWKQNKQISALCILSGLIGLVVPGGSLALQMVQIFLQAALLGCCLLAFRRERASRKRRKRFFKSRKQGKEQGNPRAVAHLAAGGRCA